jgi:hypothetical protein
MIHRVIRYVSYAAHITSMQTVKNQYVGSNTFLEHVLALLRYYATCTKLNVNIRTLRFIVLGCEVAFLRVIVNGKMNGGITYSMHMQYSFYMNYYDSTAFRV